MNTTASLNAELDHIEVERLAAGFIHTLRSGGLTVPVSSSLRYVESLRAVGLGNGDDVYWAGRATLVVRPEDIAMYNAMFLAFFHRDGSGFKVRFEDEPEAATIGIDEGGEGEGDASDDDTVALRYSATEVLGDKDFADFTKAELVEAQRVMARMRLTPAKRASRRRVASDRGTRNDLRGTVRAAMRAEGEPIALARTSTGTRTRRLVLLLDVSGSMEPYARVLIRFAHAAVVGRGRVEVFALGTRLTRMTRQLGSHDVDEAVETAAASVVDWSGGTRLGERLGHTTTSGASAVCRVGRSWSCFPTVGIGATPKRWVARWNVLHARLTGLCGSIRSKQAPDTNRSLVAWPRPYLMSTRSLKVTASTPWPRWPTRSERNGRDTIVTGEPRAMKDLLDDIDRWKKQGKEIAVARVVDLDGSGPRLPGAAMVVSGEGEVAGSVSGGCVEGAVVTEALQVLESGERKMISFGYSDDEAFSVGLTCGGTIHLFIEPLDW